MVTSAWNYSIVLLLISFILSYIYFTRKFNYWKKRNVKFEKPVPFMGNLLPIMCMKQSLGEWLRDLCHKFENEDYFGIFTLDRPVLVVQSPKIIRSILQKDFSYFQDRSVTAPERNIVLSNVMFFSNNPQWKKIRTKLTPVFTSGKLKLMFKLILEQSRAMSDYIKGIANVPNVETKEICTKYSVNVIAKCAFAVDAKAFENDEAEFRILGHRMFDSGYQSIFRRLAAWMAPNVVNWFNIEFFDPNTISRLTSIFKEVLHNRMNSELLKGQDLVDILLEANKSNQVSDIRELAMVGQAIQFFAAGFETVSSILSFALYELCIHPELQTKLRKEILDNIEKHNGITYEGLSEMKYLDMCVSETLRKYPVVPFLDRICKANYKLEDSDLVIEKGVPIYISLFALHYNPKLFPDPDKFNPERFANKNAVNQDGLYYIPFGEGPRICIGNRFGLITVKLGLTTLLSKYKLEISDKTPLTLQFEKKRILIQSKVGLPLKFVPI